MPPDDLLNAALEYAARGWAVFPVHSINEKGLCTCGKPDCPDLAKHPLTLHGFKDATTNPEIITTWWTKWPWANIGIACGPSGLAVVDIDNKTDPPGWETWLDLLDLYGRDLGKTSTVETPGPGLHLYYLNDDQQVRNTEGKLGPHIDTRGVGGYVIAPPSRHANGGTYSWALDYSLEDIQPAPFPQVLASLLISSPVQPQQRPQVAPSTTTPGEGFLWLGRALDRARLGNRNDTGFWLACQLRDAGFPKDTAAAYMRQYAASVPQSEDAPYSESEALHSLKEAYDGTTRGSAISVGPQPSSQALSDSQLLAKLASLPLTDAGNAEAFWFVYGATFRHERLRQDGGGIWLVWSDHHWRESKRGEIERAALMVARARMAATSFIADKAIHQAAVRWARQSESRHRLEAMLAMARTIMPQLATLPKDYDCDPWLLACRNGVVNLRTGQLRAGQPTDMITMSTRVAYDPNAACPRWEQFLMEVFDGDKALIHYIQKAVGYSLTGDIGEPALFLCWGSGRNGKTTLLNVLRQIAGEYGVNTPASTFEMNQRTNIPNDMAALRGRRLVTASETSESSRLNEARIKAMTGRDPITARFLHGEFFTYDPTYHIWLAMNHKPIVTGTDLGIWSRIKLIPFTVCFLGHEDRMLPIKLEAELPGILAWAIRGCLAWQQEGLDPPSAVQVATENYRTESDSFRAFVNECCVVDPGAFVPAGVLRQEYEAWCRENGSGKWEIIRARQWGRRLKELGCRTTRQTIDGTQVRGWIGIGLADGRIQGSLDLKTDPLGSIPDLPSEQQEPASEEGQNANQPLDGLGGLDVTSQFTPIYSTFKAMDEEYKHLSNPSNPSTTDPSSAMPTMITHRMVQRLLGAGYRREEIRNMTPEEAWERIERAGGLSDDDEEDVDGIGVS